MNLFTKQNQTDRLRELTQGYQKGRTGEKRQGVWNEHIHFNIYQVDNEKDILNRTGDSIEETVITYIRKNTEKEQIYIYV